MYVSIANEVYGIFVHSMVKALIGKGLDVCVVSPVPFSPFPYNYLNSKWHTYSLIPARSAWDEVEVFYPRYVSFPRAWLYSTSGLRLYQGINKLIETIDKEFDFDIIHAHVALPDGYAGALLSKKYKRPLIITVHGQDLQHTVNKNASCRKAIALALNQASKIILVSNKLRNLAYESIVDKNKLIVIPNGVNAKEIARAEKFVDKNDAGYFRVLSVSNLVATKGIDLNIHAIKKLIYKYPCLQYWVVGNGSELRKLSVLVDQLGLNENVLFLGQQPHEEVMKIN